MTKDLFAKLTQLFESHTCDTNKVVYPITENIIKLVDIGNGAFRADVICVFCESNDHEIEVLIKRHAVQCDKFGLWNFSNLKKHIRNIHLTKKTLNPDAAQSPSDSPRKSPTSTAKNITDIPFVLFDDPEIIFEESSQPSNLNSILYNQFAIQNLRLIQATLTHHEIYGGKNLWR